MVPNFAGICHELTDCLAKDRPEKIIITPSLLAAFEQLKEALIKKPVLSPPNFKKDFLLQTDSSSHSIAAILAQHDDDGNEIVLSYASRKLLPRERQYSTIQQECLAIFWATRMFENWIYGRKVIVQSDHKPLAWLSTMTNHNSMLMRWNLYLQRYDLQFEWKKGSENTNVDSLTRLKTIGSDNE
jgi:hypothetical protein